MTKLTKTQLEFYQENYQNIILMAQKAYDELVKCADQEGLQWLRSNINKLGQEARRKFRERHKDILR